MYENKTHITLNLCRNAQLAWKRRICGNTRRTDDGATHDDAASTALCAKDHDGYASIL